MTEIITPEILEKIEKFKKDHSTGDRDAGETIAEIGKLFDSSKSETLDLFEKIGSTYCGICTQYPRKEAELLYSIAASWLEYGMSVAPEMLHAKAWSLYIDFLLSIPHNATDFYQSIYNTIYFGSEHSRSDILKNKILPKIAKDSEFLDLKEDHMGPYPVTEAKLSTQILAAKIYKIIQKCDLYQGYENENIAISAPLPVTEHHTEWCLVVFKKIKNNRGHVLFVSAGEPEFISPENEIEEMLRIEFPHNDIEGRIWENFLAKYAPKRK